MALQTYYEAYLTFLDSKNTTTERSVILRENDAKAYFAAADEAAAAATAVGLFLTRFRAASAAVCIGFGVRNRTYDDVLVNPPLPDDDIYNSDKLTIGYAGGINNYVLTIPAWDRTKFNHVGRDGFMDLATPADAAGNLKTSFDAVVLTPKTLVAGTLNYYRKTK